MATNPIFVDNGNPPRPRVVPPTFPITDAGPGNPSIGPNGSAQAQQIRGLGSTTPVADALASEARAPTPSGPPSAYNAANPGAPDAMPPGGAQPKPGFSYNPAEGLRNAGTTVGNAAVNAGPKVASALKSAGAATGRALMGTGGNATISAIAATAGHGNAYSDNNVPLGDKFRMGATDATTALGALGGSLFGGGLGSVAGPVGTFTGAVGGGMAGGGGGHWLGNKLFGGDAALQRNGYDPEHGLAGAAKDFYNGKGSASFGVRTPVAGAGRGFVNPGDANPNSTVAPENVSTATSPNIMPPQQPQGGPLVPTDSANPPGREVPGVPGIRRIDATGKNPLYTDGGNVRGPSVVGNDMGAIQRGADAERNLGLAKMGLQDHGDSNYYLGGAGRNGPTSSGADTGGYGLDHAGANRKGNDIAELARSGKLSGAGLAAVVQARGQDQSAAVSTRGQDVGANTARLQNDTTIRGHQLTADVGMRGQDISLMGHRMTNDIARANLAREQGNFEATYNAGRTDAGNAQDAKHFDQRASALKDLHTEIANQLPQIDGKPDADTAARYAAGLNAHMASRQQALQQELQVNPGDSEARSELNGIVQNGVGAMNSVGKQKLIAGMQLKDMRTANHNAMNPFAGTDVESAAPVSGLRKKSGVFSDEYRTLGENGKEDGGSIPARVVDQPGSFLGLGGRRSNTFEIMKPKGNP